MSRRARSRRDKRAPVPEFDLVRLRQGCRRRIADLEAQRRRDQRAVIGNHSFQGADFISVLLSSSCEFFRLAISFSV